MEDVLLTRGHHFGMYTSIISHRISGQILQFLHLIALTHRRVQGLALDNWYLTYLLWLHVLLCLHIRIIDESRWHLLWSNHIVVLLQGRALSALVGWHWWLIAEVVLLLSSSRDSLSLLLIKWWPFFIHMSLLSRRTEHIVVAANRALNLWILALLTPLAMRWQRVCVGNTIAHLHRWFIRMRDSIWWMSAGTSIFLQRWLILLRSMLSWFLTDSKRTRNDAFMLI